jgi:hypothetical protein
VTSSPEERQEFLLEIVSSRRILQENETLPVIVDGSIGQNELGANAQGIRNCGSDLSILWDNNENAHPLPGGMVTIDEQSHTSVTFTVTQTWPEDDFVNWMAVLFPLDPKGNNACPGDAFSLNQQMTYTANCYDYQSTAFVYLNVNDGSSQLEGNSTATSSAYVPKGCKVPEATATSGTTIVYELSFPCSACVEGAMEIREGSNRRKALEASSIKKGQIPKHSSRLAHSLAHKNKRSLQDFGAASSFEMDFLIVGDDSLNPNSAAISFGKLAMLLSMSLSVCLSLVLA